MSPDKQDHSYESQEVRHIQSEDLGKPENLEDITTGPSPPSEWIQGWRLAAIALGTCIAVGMTQADSTIASTAILVITDDLGGFDTSPWVFTGYLITYGGMGSFPIILARVSDIVGRKAVFLTCLLMFTIFSGACGASQTLLEMIMFRWVQGLGASGVLSIGTLYGFELRPPGKWPAYSALISLAVSISLSIALVIGAALTQIGQWRWIFLINAPIGATGFLLLMLGMPSKLPREPASHAANVKRWYHNLQKLDFPGVFALVGASVLLTAALEQAAAGRSFAAHTIIPLLVLAPIFLLVFLFWQWFSTTRPGQSIADPILSWNLLSDRVFLGVLINAFFSGAIITVSIVQIPQRFIIVNGLSPIDAGVRLIPFTAVMAFTAVIMSIVLSKSNIPVLYWLLFGGLLQVAGIAGFSQLSVNHDIEPSQYGFQILAGAGVGMFNVVLLLLTPYVVENQHLGMKGTFNDATEADRRIAVANGAINQFRLLGGSFGLSIVVCASNSSLRHHLLSILEPSQVSVLLSRTETILALPDATQIIVRKMFGQSYNLQMLIVIGFAAANIPVSLM
ncbi:MFS general substrate transporter [Venustampulla echinocandica]|uniref:MFS general substrate transporter n=1 Tax=Venustampulla echinocandica TaxID=2656787 RepID=A0A370TU65_9HELO|nr:MFS general substrate transporter [Venustampulla echinocandica]RDL39059.1 MFS general substrate transporter [Venustampulla echinocandica]